MQCPCRHRAFCSSHFLSNRKVRDFYTFTLKKHVEEEAWMFVRGLLCKWQNVTDDPQIVGEGKGKKSSLDSIG